MGAGITKGADGITTKLKAMLARGDNMRGAFARIYPMYQRFQTIRFQTENASEGEKWPELNAEYAKYKPRRYGGGPRRKSKKRGAGTWNSYPGGGRKMLIGTGMLAGAAIGPGAPFEGTSNHRALFTNTQMYIAVEESGENPDGNRFDYAHFVAARRPFMTFGSVSLAAMRAEIAKFVVGS